MSRKGIIIDKMSMYFAEKGKVVTRNEYVRSGGGPFSVQAILRTCGSWARMVSICNRTYPDRMEFTRQEPKVVKEPTKVVIPPKAEEGSLEGIATAEDALAKLRGSNE